MSAPSLQRYSGPDKSCPQPAEGTAEQTLLQTCNTSISLSFRPLSMKAKLCHRHKAGLKRLCPACHRLRGTRCAEGPPPSQGWKASCPLPPDAHPLMLVSKLMGLQSSTHHTQLDRSPSVGTTGATAALCPSRQHASHQAAETVSQLDNFINTITKKNPP